MGHSWTRVVRLFSHAGRQVAGRNERSRIAPAWGSLPCLAWLAVNPSNDLPAPVTRTILAVFGIGCLGQRPSISHLHTAVLIASTKSTYYFYSATAYA